MVLAMSNTETNNCIITIAGKPGSGKSTISKRLAATLGYKHFSSGDLFRAIAREKNVSVDAINLLAEDDTSIDKAVDNKLQELGEHEDEIVIDSRMAWYWIPQSLKVYLDLDLGIAADRIYSSDDTNRFEIEERASSVEEYERQLSNRLDSESKRYLTLYGQNPYDTNNYDIVIDTHKNNPEQVEKIILDSFNQKCLSA